jgi:hypothetical protein
MSRGARVAVMSASVGPALILGYPYSCGESSCIDPGYCPATCENVLGMTFRGGPPGPPLPILVTIAIGVAVGWLVVLAISKLRSRRA